MDIAEVQGSRWYRILVSVGLASYGLLHLVIAWIALQLAFGKKGNASNQGALAELSRQPLGAVLLWVMAVGLFTLTIWQVLEAAVGRQQGDRGHRIRRRLSSVGRAVVYLGLGILTVQAALGSGSQSNGKGQQTLSARLMSVPFGQVLVAAVGLAVIAVGVTQVVKGVKKKFTEDLAANPGRAARPLGTVGFCAKGVALGIIGALFVWAAVSYDPKKAGGMDAALTTIRNQPFGAVLLVVMALGLACFGAYCFLWARRPRY